MFPMISQQLSTKMNTQLFQTVLTVVEQESCGERKYVITE